MKKTTILAAALSFAALASCSKVENIESAQEEPQTVHVTFTAAAPPAPTEEGETKVGIEGDHTTGFSTFWELGDQVRVYVSSNSYFADCSVTSVNEQGCATFYGTFQHSTGKECVFIAQYGGLASGRWQILPSQTMDGNAFDKTTVVMFSKPETGYHYSWQRFSDLKFVHACTFLNIYVKEISANTVSGDETVKSVTVTVQDKQIAGEFSIPWRTDALQGKTFDMTKLIELAETAVNTITVSVPEGTKLKDLSAMAVAAPFELKNQPLTICIETDKHSLKKTVNFTRNFSAAKMTALGFKIDKSFDIKPYIKVTQSDLTLSYLGETCSFDIAANVSWTVDESSVPEGLTVVKNGDVLMVTAPRSQHFGDKEFPIRLVGAGVSTTVTFTQPSLFEVNRGCQVNADGSVLVGVGNEVPQLTLKEKTKTFGVALNIKDGKGFSDATTPMLSAKLDTKTLNGNPLYLDYYIGGGDKGNGIYHNGVLVKEIRNITSAEFNKLSYFSFSRSNWDERRIYVYMPVKFSDGTQTDAVDYYPFADLWSNCQKGTMTVKLDNRGGGSFVISSYIAATLE